MTRPRTGANPRSTRARRAVTYTEPRDDGASSSSSHSGDEDQDPPTDDDDQGDDQDEPQPRATPEGKATARERLGGYEEEQGQEGEPGAQSRADRKILRAAETFLPRAGGQQLSLSRLVQLPLDVLATIFSACDLQSVFYLSRLNKKFRAFLLSPGMKGVWNAAWRNSDLPATIDLSRGTGFDVLAWSNVLFGDCEVCGQKSNNVEPRLRVKACAMPYACFNALTIHSVRLEDGDPRRELTQLVASATPKQGRNSRPMFLLADFEDAAAGRAAAEAATEEERETGTFEHRRFGPIPLKDFRGHLCELLKKQDAEGEAIDKWLAEQKTKQARAKQDVNKQRVADIKARFIALGFEEQHFDAGFLGHKQVRAARPLTDNTWPTVRNALQPYLEQVREAALARALSPIRQGRLSKLFNQYVDLTRLENFGPLKEHGLYPLPVWDDLATLDSFKDLYWPAEAEVGPTTLVDNVAVVGAELRAKKAALFPEFFELVRSSLAGIEGRHRDRGKIDAPYFAHWLTEEFSDAEQHAALATCLALFECTQCRALDTFPNVLSHPCVDSKRELVSGAAVAPTFAGRASAAQYEVPCSSVCAALRVVGAAGLADDVADPTASIYMSPDLSPLAVPHDALERLGNSFSCVDCPPTFDALARNWIGITNHSLDYRHATLHSIVYETPALAQLRLLKAHEEWHKDQRGVYT
ncbi:hypothetical protein JCM11491_000692 [Sporobolomyces phaffii]